LYVDDLAGWFAREVGAEWASLRADLFRLLQREAELQEIVQLVGPDALQDDQRLIIEVGKMLREDFLQQSSFSEIDAHCPMEKAYGMLRAILLFYDEAGGALKRSMLMDEILNLKQIEEIARMKEVPKEQFPAYIQAWFERLPEAFGAKTAAGGA